MQSGLAGGVASWHRTYEDSAYIFVGNLDFRLSEGDVIVMFSQLREFFLICIYPSSVVVDVLVRRRTRGSSSIIFEERESDTVDATSRTCYCRVEKERNELIEKNGWTGGKRFSSLSLS